MSTVALVLSLDHALQRLGEQIILFVNDTLITSETNKQHLEHLDEISDRLDKNNLTLNLTKSNFLEKETNFLGFILTTEGIKLDPEKIRNIQDFPAPRIVEQQRGFPGPVNFYSKFRKEHAELRSPGEI